MRNIANSAGLSAAIPTSQITRPLSMSFYGIGHSDGLGCNTAHCVPLSMECSVLMKKRRTFTYFHSAHWPRRFPPLFAAAPVVASPHAGGEGVYNDLKLLHAHDVRAT